MRHRTAGKIADNLWYLGREEAGVYILEGKEGSIMINGGLAHILPDVLKQMKEFGIDPARLKKILILHSHFDHIGVIPYFKRNWPAIEVYGSEGNLADPQDTEGDRHRQPVQQNRGGQDGARRSPCGFRLCLAG